jgi:hypothetical protein
MEGRICNKGTRVREEGGKRRWVIAGVKEEAAMKKTVIRGKEGKERKGKERKGKERKGKERRKESIMKEQESGEDGEKEG